MRKPQLYSHMQQRGHLNDTIVVNQPRITSEDMLEFDTTTDSIGDPVEFDTKHGIILEEDVDGEHIVMRDEYYIEEEDIEEDEEEEDLHTVVAGTSSSSNSQSATQLHLPDAGELSESTALLASNDEFIEESEIISHEVDGDGLQLVKLKITNPDGKEGITWVNFVSQ